MEIQYKNKKIKNVCTNREIAIREYGRNMTKKIMLRMLELASYPTVAMLIEHRIGRCHKLQGNRKDQYAMDLIHPYRLIFIIVDNSIQVVEIQEIIDYH